LQAVRDLVANERDKKAHASMEVPARNRKSMKNHRLKKGRFSVALGSISMLDFEK